MPFLKGHTINLGRIMPEEERIKHSIAMIGSNNHRYGVPAWNKGKRCQLISGEKNGCWKGDEATYQAKHIWMKVNFGKATKCDNKNCEGISKNYQWANISGEYKRIRSDWKSLCISCHKKYDYKKIYGNKCKKGHIYTKENTYILRGCRYCRICSRNRGKKFYYKNKEKNDKS